MGGFLIARRLRISGFLITRLLNRRGLRGHILRLRGILRLGSGQANLRVHRSGDIVHAELFAVDFDHLVIFGKIALQIHEDFVRIFTRAVVDCRCVLLRLCGDAACAGERFFIYFALADAVVKLCLRVRADAVRLRLRLA